MRRISVSGRTTTMASRQSKSRESNASDTRVAASTRLGLSDNTTRPARSASNRRTIRANTIKPRSCHSSPKVPQRGQFVPDPIFAEHRLRLLCLPSSDDCLMGRFDRPHQRRMQCAESRGLPVGCVWRRREPLGRIREIDLLAEVELRVVTQVCQRECCRAIGLENRKLSAKQVSYALARAIGDPHSERSLLTIDVYNKYRSGLGAWMDAIREMAPDNVTRGRGVWPVANGHSESSPKRRERTWLVSTLPASFLICLSWAAVSGPSSGSYCGRTRTAI